jgi:hypothetical protein
MCVVAFDTTYETLLDMEVDTLALKVNPENENPMAMVVVITSDQVLVMDLVSVVHTPWVSFLETPPPPAAETARFHRPAGGPHFGLCTLQHFNALNVRGYCAQSAMVFPHFAFSPSAQCPTAK